jgi:tetratricopeptide (TPR) repeat protein
MLLGEAYDGLGKTPEAIAEFQAADKISPKEPNLHFGLGYLYWKSQQYDHAREEFERELANDPNHAQALAYLGDIEWKNNHPDAAIPFLQRAIRGKKDLRIAYVDLGAIYSQKKQYKEAQAALAQAVALDPNQPDAHYQLGRLYQAQGNSAAAARELSKVRELHAKADQPLAGKMPITTTPQNSTESK